MREKREAWCEKEFQGWEREMRDRGEKDRYLQIKY